MTIDTYVNKVVNQWIADTGLSTSHAPSLRLMLKEAMRDQRYACVESIQNLAQLSNVLDVNVVTSAIQNTNNVEMK